MIILRELNVADSGVENGLRDTESDWGGGGLHHY